MTATKWWVAFLLLIVSANVFALSPDAKCMAYILHKESRGESMKVARAVADVVENRTRILDKTICQVMQQPGQFPYVRRSTKIRLDTKAIHRYDAVMESERVLTEDYFYFNHRRQKWGTGTRKIGKLYFSKRKQ